MHEVTNETGRLLQEISKACTVCNTFGARSYNFKITFPPEEIVFYRELAFDLFFWLDSRARLHVVDISTGSGNATFLRCHTVEHVWQAFLECWVTLYLGFPELMMVDQGTQFTSTRWEQRVATFGTVLKKTSGIESHNSLGLGERYHVPLRHIYTKIGTAQPYNGQELVLRLACKVMNDTAGPDGIVPTELVFEKHARLPLPATHVYLDQSERIQVLRLARAEYEAIVDRNRISQALRSRIPSGAKRMLRIDDLARVFRETDRRIHGPYEILKMEDKLCRVERVHLNI